MLETELGTETFHIDITLASKSVRKLGADGYSLGSPDVSVSLTSSDLGSVIQGSLSPLQVKYSSLYLWAFSVDIAVGKFQFIDDFVLCFFALRI